MAAGEALDKHGTVASFVTDSRVGGKSQLLIGDRASIWNPSSTMAWLCDLGLDELLNLPCVSFLIL